MAIMTVGLISWVKVAGANEGPKTADVLQTLHRSNQKEIAAGKIAERSARSSEMRTYGKVLQKDHDLADKKVTELAKEENIVLTDGSTGGDMSDLAADPMFDTKFAVAMLGNHKKDIADGLDARDNTGDPRLKKLLIELVPTQQKHEEMAQKIIDTEATK